VKKGRREHAIRAQRRKQAAPFKRRCLFRRRGISFGLPR
jgi:hypothetical protein